MGDLDDISCKTCLHLKIVVLKTSCCVTNSVKKKTKQRALILHLKSLFQFKYFLGLK